MAYNSKFYNDFRTELGQLSDDRPARAAGKQILDWVFTAVGSQESVPVKVMLLSSKDPEGGPLLFQALCPRLAEPITDTDINRLHQSVERELLGQAEAMAGTEWTEWFEVAVRGDSSDFKDSAYSAWGADLHIQVSRLKRGIHPRTGEPVTINRNKVVVPFPKPCSIGRDDEQEDGQSGIASPVGVGIRIHDKPGERSYIPATPENTRALQELLGRMTMLRQSLASLLSQEQVADRLADIESNQQVFEAISFERPRP